MIDFQAAFGHHLFQMGKLGLQARYQRAEIEPFSLRRMAVEAHEAFCAAHQEASSDV
jgi:hypothetical protein